MRDEAARSQWMTRMALAGMHAVVTGGGARHRPRDRGAPRATRGIADAARSRRGDDWRMSQRSLPLLRWHAAATSAMPPPCVTAFDAIARAGHRIAILVNNRRHRAKCGIREHRRALWDAIAAREPHGNVPLHAGSAACAADGAHGRVVNVASTAGSPAIPMSLRIARRSTASSD
jgi:hypothetical protein